ncbi:hypothetical protein [Streptomyces sp. GS7]|uniref:hypothetical protein n=1 Tax=Streptomyces sp. GS7 TaxID=2692234 RepID=UPI0013174459|nr:hypothetical protein [Streptomyces sp. GS7]QHC23696.1 hypothetical protein GR130_22375 [Streptomyces sp. GS7]
MTGLDLTADVLVVSGGPVAALGGADPPRVARLAVSPALNPPSSNGTSLPITSRHSRNP